MPISSISGREAFERAIVRGNELLRENLLAEAQRAFLDALQYDPDNARALALLGLTYFRASRFSDASPIYEDLCVRLPSDASHHLNLGLVRLKLGDTEGAIEALEISRRLDPSQGRAVNYLGLAFARAGRYVDAYRAFLIAGQSDLAAEIAPNLSNQQRNEVERALDIGDQEDADGGAEPAPPNAGDDRSARESREASEAGESSDDFSGLNDLNPPSSEVAAEVPAGPAERRTVRSIGIGGVIRRPATASPSRHFVTTPAPAAPPVAASPEAAAPAEPENDTAGAITRAVARADPASSGRDAGSRVGVGNHPPMPLSQLAMHSLVRPDDGDHPFELSDNGSLLVRVVERVFCRMSGVYATGGRLDFETAHRRSRGVNTEERFDHGGDPLSIVSGQGYLVAFPDRGRFTAVYLDDDTFYLREEKVFAFSATLRWENGNIPGLRGKLPVVQFRGDGAVAFRTTKMITPVKLPANDTLFVDANALVGWIGRVIPRAVVQPAGGPMADVCVECTGEGVVLVESLGAPGILNSRPDAGDHNDGVAGAGAGRFSVTPLS